MLRKRMILFLSTGDTCRSPMAAIYLRHLLDLHGVKNVDVRTAGVSTIVGLLASQETIQILASVGLDAGKHRSNQMTSVTLKKAAVVFGMTPFHVQRALRLDPSVRGKVHLLKEFAETDLSKVQIDDPMGGTLEIYRKCFAEITEAIDRLVMRPDVVGKELTALSEPYLPADQVPIPVHGEGEGEEGSGEPAPSPEVEKNQEAAKKEVTEEAAETETGDRDKAKKAKDSKAKDSKAKASGSKKSSASKPAAKKPAAKKSSAKSKAKSAGKKKTAAKRKPAAKKSAGKKASGKGAATKRKTAAKRKPATKRKPAAKKTASKKKTAAKRKPAKRSAKTKAKAVKKKSSSRKKTASRSRR